MLPSPTVAEPGPRRSRFTPTHQILLGLAVGCAIGCLAPSFAVSLKVISDLFLRMIRMVIGPLLFTTLVVGVAGAGASMVGRLGLKAIIWFELATTAALGLGLLTANVMKPGAGVVLSANVADLAKLEKAKSFSDFLLDIVPKSFADAMAQNNVLQIVVFSVLFGLAVSAAGARGRLIKDVAEAGAEAMFKLVGFVMRFAPFGVGAAIAVTIGTHGAGVLLQLLKCVVALYIALIVFFALLFTALRVFTRIHIPTFLRAIREPAVIAFTTSTSDAALPRAIQALEQLGIPRRIVGFVVPTGYAFNLDGSTLYLSLALVFVAQISGVNMSWGEQLEAMLLLMAASKGVAGVPRAALVVLNSVAPHFGLPLEPVAMLLGVDAFMDMGRTCVNVVGNCVATVIVAAWEGAIPPDAAILGPRAVPVIDGVRAITVASSSEESGQ
jgi:proton glutamate symport protein